MKDREEVEKRYKESEDGRWITVKGRHIFIRRGENPSVAFEKIRKELEEKPLTDDEKKDKLDKEECSERKTIDSSVRNKIGSVRKQLEKYGKAKVDLYTWNYCYLVEIHDDDEYSYTILSRRRLK